MDKETATKHGFAIGDRVLINLPNRAQTFTITGLVTFGSADNLAGVTLAGFDPATAQGLFDLRGYYNTISVLASPGADTVKVQRAIAAVLPRGRRSCKRPNRGQRALERDQQRARVHLDRAPDLRVHRVAGRRVHDLQHVLDHGWAADARARAAARGRGQPATAVPLGAGRGGADWPDRVADRTRAGRSRGARPEGPAQGVRDRAAVGAAGVRGAHGGGRDPGRRRRDDDLGDHPCPPRRPHRSGGRARRAARGHRARGCSGSRWCGPWSRRSPESC